MLPRLYGTVSGMKNYSKAIELLYRVENPEVVQLLGGNTDKLERELKPMARNNFKFVVSMQRFSKLSSARSIRMRRFRCTYLDLQIAYSEEPPRKEGGDPRIFWSLIDDNSELIQSNLCIEGGKEMEANGRGEGDIVVGECVILLDFKFYYGLIFITLRSH